MGVPALLHEFINIIREIDLTFFWTQVGVKGWLVTVSPADLQSKGLGKRLVRVILVYLESTSGMRRW